MGVQTQLVPLQSGVVPLQVVPQEPQWLALLATQLPPQQSWPAPQLVAVQTQVPLPSQVGVAPLQVEVQVWLVQVRH